MNKLNKCGCQILEYKNELNKDYPDIVIKSLLSTVDKLAEDGVMDVDTHFALKEKNISIESLEELLLSKQTFLKTHEELFNEYECIRNKINKMLGIDPETEGEIKTLSSVQDEMITINKEFILTEEFIKNYFYIESDRDYETLIKRKGFVEKFAILRLDKILRDFIKDKLSVSNKYEVLNSNVFFESERNIYGIYLLFKVPINNLEQEEEANSLIDEIKNIIVDSNEYYNHRMTT